LAVRWTDGTNYLLTWPNAETRPIDRKFLMAYEAAIKPTDPVGSLDARRLREISKYIALHKDNLRPFALPWCTNCQALPEIEKR